MLPDITHCTIKGEPALDALSKTNSSKNMEEWYKKEFIPRVQQRGAEIINARGSSSAASAANACLVHNREWELNNNDDWFSMAVNSNGEYGMFY